MNYAKKLLSDKKNIFFLIFCFYPWLLISGPLLSDAGAIILSIYFLYNKFSKKNFNEFKNVFFILFCFFCLYIFLNSIFIGQSYLSIKSSIFYIRFGIFALAIIYILKENEDRLKYFFFNICIIIVVLFIDSIFQKIHGTNLFGVEMYHSIRVSSLFGDELILGSYTIKLLPIVLAFSYLLFTRKNIRNSLIIISLSITLILLSAEKAALVMIVIFLTSFIIKLNLNKKNKFFLFVVFSLLISSILLSSQTIQKRLISEFVKNIGYGQYIYSKMHDSHYKTAYKMFEDKPLFGHGPKMFRVKCSNKKYEVDQFSCATHPHNYSLQLLSETGIIGFIFFLLFYLSLLKMLFKLLISNLFKEKYSFSLYIMCCSLFIIYLPIAPSGNIFNNWSSCINTFSIGIMLYFLQMRSKNILK
tara:strand:+ start:1863 stop:3107 length:1245 start_codon:yes stop_codon:yes gene_type:complete